MTTTTLGPSIRPAAGEPWPVLEDLAYLRTVIVNVYFVGPASPGSRGLDPSAGENSNFRLTLANHVF